MAARTPEQIADALERAEDARRSESARKRDSDAAVLAELFAMVFKIQDRYGVRFQIARSPEPTLIGTAGDSAFTQWWIENDRLIGRMPDSPMFYRRQTALEAFETIVGFLVRTR